MQLFCRSREKSLPFYIFFRMREHCLKIAYGTHQNALMGTFCRILHWPPCSGRSWRDAFVSKPTQVIGAGLIHSLSAVTNVLFTLLTQNCTSVSAGWTRSQANYIIFFLIYTWIRKPRFWAFTMFGEWTVYKQSCTIASGVKDCGLVFSPSPHFFSLDISWPAWQKNGWTTDPSLCFCLALQWREAE